MLVSIDSSVCNTALFQVAEQTGQSKLPAGETVTEVDPLVLAERQVGCSLNMATTMSANNNVNPPTAAISSRSHRSGDTSQGPNECEGFGK